MVLILADGEQRSLGVPRVLGDGGVSWGRCQWDLVTEPLPSAWSLPANVGSERWGWAGSMKNKKPQRMDVVAKQTWSHGIPV